MRGLWLAAVVAGSLVAGPAGADVRQGLAAFAAGQFSDALVDWQDAANAGDAAAALYLGVMYDTGMGVPQDPGRALAWYERGAAQGNVTAMLNAAIMYDAGQGVSRDTEAAITWYRRAAAHGSGRADYNLGLIDRAGGRRAEAIQYFRRAAARGVTAALAQLGELGVRPPRAGTAPPGDPAMAAFQQAQDLLLSRGVAESSRAAVLFRQSAEGGNALAAYNLAYCYEHGIGLPPDRQAAVIWYRRSAAAAQSAELKAVAEASAQRLSGTARPPQ